MDTKFSPLSSTAVCAGVYVSDRLPEHKALIDGETRRVCTRIDAPSERPVHVEDAHPAYIS